MPKQSQRRKVVIVGMDGVSYSLLLHYMQIGIMPGLCRMCEHGRLYPLKSSLPEVSSVAWTSFMTGKTPGYHGIFGFSELDRISYQLEFPNVLAIREPPVWKDTSLQWIIFNLPQTYPAQTLNGVMVSGFVSVDFEKAVYPKRLYHYLKSLDYRLDVKTHLAARDPESFFADLFHVLDKRLEAARYLFANEPWDVFLAVITETDRLHHFFHDSAKEGAYHHVFKEIYRRIDSFLWEMYLKAQENEALFMTCSDHGFESICREVHVNTFLESLGYLEAGLENFQALTGKTKVFAMDPSRIYIHSASCFSRGNVPQMQRENLMDELRDRFLQLEFEGRPVVDRVYFGEEIFDGPEKDRAPDLYVLAKPSFDMKATLGKAGIFGRSHFQGCHTYGEAHLYVSETDIDIPAELKIEQLATIVFSQVADGFAIT